MASYGLWFTRDILSMAFIVTLPPIITPQIQRASEHLGWEISPGAVESRSLPTVQLIAPLISTGNLSLARQRAAVQGACRRALSWGAVRAGSYRF